MSSLTAPSRFSNFRPLGLLEILHELPEEELYSLINRLTLSVDSAKRLDIPTQVARAVTRQACVSNPSLLPPASAELFRQIVANRGRMVVDALPPSAQILMSKALVFACPAEEGGIELIVPAAHVVQLPHWEGEDPRGLRALLAQLLEQPAAGVAAHYLGRPALSPIALDLELAWIQLMDERAVRQELAELAPVERKLLSMIEAAGGEVSTQELLEMEKEPLRIRGAASATLSRRGIGFALERRGFLLPVHPNRHIIPTEIAEIVGEARLKARRERRAQVVQAVLAEDHVPRRANFADPPAVFSLGLSMAVREQPTEVRPDVGIPKTLVQRLSNRFGKSAEQTTFSGALGRAVGLWDESAIDSESPPGSLGLAELNTKLFSTWRAGGVWDEAHPEGEVLRMAASGREVSASGILRELVIDAVEALAPGQWVPWAALEAYILTDDRLPRIYRLLERWGSRAGVSALPPLAVIRRVALQSLHWLGVLDLGDAAEIERLLTEIPSEDEILQKVKGEIWELLDGPSIRLTVLGRALLASEIGLGAATFSSGFVEDRGLRIGDYTLVSDVVSLSPFVDVGQAGGELILQVTAAALARSLAQGVEQAEILERLSLIAEPTEELSRVIRQASTVLGRAEMIQAQGFLWIDDAEVRHMLSSRRQTADMFVNPSPLGGLLIVPGVELDKLAQRLRALGVELRVEGQAYLARISQAPASRRTGVPSQAPASRRGGGSASQAPASRRSSGTSAVMQVAVPESKRRPSETAAAGPASRRTRKKASSDE